MNKKTLTEYFISWLVDDANNRQFSFFGDGLQSIYNHQTRSTVQTTTRKTVKGESRADKFKIISSYNRTPFTLGFSIKHITGPFKKQAT